MANQKKQSTETAVREIRRRSRRKFYPEEKIRFASAPKLDAAHVAHQRDEPGE
jgi:hypothetical protein